MIPVRPKRTRAAQTACGAALAALALAAYAHGAGGGAPAAGDDAARREIAGDLDRFSDAVRRKDVPGLAAFLRGTAAADLQVKMPYGAALALPDFTRPRSEWKAAPLTRDMLVKDLPAADKVIPTYGPSFRDYTVQSTQIQIDKLVVFGGAALAITTGRGRGAFHDAEAQADPGHEHWSSFAYRDCETWGRTPQGWKLREVYLLAFQSDFWRLHGPGRSVPPPLGF